MTNFIENNCCRLCSSKLNFKFNSKILKKYNVNYYECMECRSLQTESPYWLEEAYKHNLSKLDTGAVQRNINNFAFCFAFSKIFNIKVALDFGGSDGLLCRFLRDHNIECYAYDRYTIPIYAQNFDSPPCENIDLVTSFEVLEHLSNPSKDLDEIFSFDSNFVLCSTEIYIEQSEDWWYLANESGQHIFFYSVEAINFIARKYHYEATLMGGKILFYKSNVPNVKNLIVGAQMVLNDWIFRAIKSYVFTLPTPGVEKDFNFIKERGI